MEKRLVDARRAATPRTAAFPGYANITIFQRGRRGRCDHVPIVRKLNGDAFGRFIKEIVKAYPNNGKKRKEKRNEQKKKKRKNVFK